MFLRDHTIGKVIVFGNSGRFQFRLDIKIKVEEESAK